MRGGRQANAEWNFESNGFAFDERKMSADALQKKCDLAGCQKIGMSPCPSGEGRNHHERIIQQTLEEVVEVPVPMAQEEIMHVPMVVNHHRHHHVEQANLFRSTGICFETSSSEACGTMT